MSECLGEVAGIAETRFPDSRTTPVSLCHPPGGVSCGLKIPGFLLLLCSHTPSLLPSDHRPLLSLGPRAASLQESLYYRHPWPLA